MNGTECFQCSGVCAQRHGQRGSCCNIEEKMVFVDFRISKHVVLLGGRSERLTENTTSFVLTLQRLMGQSPSDLEARLVSMINQSRPYGDRFTGCAGLISECICRAARTLGPEDWGLEVWVELDKVIVHSRDHERTGEELETVRYDRSGADEEEEEEVCPVCLKCLVVGEELRRTRCGHWFHGECIFRWMGRSRTCPMCRSSV
ncbi:hypothetical protein QJS04_geneDACA020120 [Acorus gramineus]|uniref:RING-type domain-containing protein n=1 Tax=Acorus gramineus TaxID=55184 RepID=A0AAV8ZY42_ACOGR|nr:hypothetical protein QJS04_geneDACA020120 [Acorus gramineus]